MTTKNQDERSSLNVPRTTPRYLELVEALPLRPIRINDLLAAAIVVMMPLLGIEISTDEAITSKFSAT